MFDTRIAYVAESGAGRRRGSSASRSWTATATTSAIVTAGDTIVLTPRLSPKAAQLAYVSFVGGRPAGPDRSISARGEQRPLVSERRDELRPALFARRQPDRLFDDARGRTATSMSSAANGGAPQRLTTSPGIDTDPSFSPDGSRIVFESDRSGTQQLYIMNADGIGQRRISFGGGWYAAPEWSPDGEWIAFTRRGPATGGGSASSKPDGSGEKMLTDGPRDEGPSWAASSREILFQRAGPDGRTGALPGGARRAATPRKVVHSAGRIGPRLVGSDGLMRKRSFLLAACARRAAPPRRNCRACRRRAARAPPAPMLHGHRRAARRLRSRNRAATRLFRRRQRGPDRAGESRRSPPRRNGCGSIPKSWCGSKAMATRATRATMRWRSARGARRKCAIIWCCSACPRRSCRP